MYSSIGREPSVNSLFIALLLLSSGVMAAVQYNDSMLASTQVVDQPFPFLYPNFDASPQSRFPMPLCKSVTLEEATIDQLQAAMNQGSLTAVDIVNCYLDRIEQTNGYIK